MFPMLFQAVSPAPFLRKVHDDLMQATLSKETDRVRRHTNETAIARIDAKTRRNIREHAASPDKVGRRIAELEREWDVERTLEANAATLALAGAVLGTTVNRKWFWLTGGVLGFLFQHATSGWCPPLPVLRKFGVRTQGEIDQERYALKAIRGDFPSSAANGGGDATEPLRAVSDSENAKIAREPDRIRRYTSRAQQEKLDGEMARRVRLYSSQTREVISERITELRREWSIERYLQINVAAVGLTTAALAVGKNRKWGYATCAGLSFFLFHAVEGFDPPLPLMRKAGLRSRAEIDREIYALKILRGDFDDLHGAQDEAARVEGALIAVCA
jgi:hypothetical protein